jgi:hypothetical protein
VRANGMVLASKLYVIVDATLTERNRRYIWLEGQ